MPTDTRTPPLTAAQREMELLRVVLESRGWIVNDIHQDQEALRVIAHRPWPFEPINLLNVKDL